MDLAAYFDDLMRRRPATKSGYINLPKENFKNMVEKANSENDVKTLLEAQVNYIGHRNILPSGYVDKMMLKALELGYPEQVLDVLSMHEELVYHPNQTVIKAYADKMS